jgi:nitroreductase
MDFLKLAQTRYTTKKYSGKQIPEAEIAKLKEILHLAPSSINSQPWQFVFVEDNATKEAFAKVSMMNEEKIKKASHLVIFMANSDLPFFEEKLQRATNPYAIDFYQQRLKVKGDVALYSWINNQVYIALGFFLSACAAMGIDSTPMEGILTTEYDKILGDKHYTTLFAVAIGYRDEEDTNQLHLKPKTRLAKEEVIKEFSL